MGKRAKKSRPLPHSSPSPGVKTRANTQRTLHLHPRLRHHPTAAPVRRSPRLLNKSKKISTSPQPKQTRNSRLGLVGVSVNSCSETLVQSFFDEAEAEAEAEASFGENVLGDRSTREATPCSLIGDSDTVGTPGSTTRAMSSSATNRERQNTARSSPSADEIDEFFAGAEREQQRIFTEKYNFDLVNETPLPGRYEWERVNP